MFNIKIRLLVAAILYLEYSPASESFCKLRAFFICIEIKILKLKSPNSYQNMYINQQDTQNSCD